MSLIKGTSQAEVFKAEPKVSGKGKKGASEQFSDKVEINSDRKEEFFEKLEALQSLKDTNATTDAQGTKSNVPFALSFIRLFDEELGIEPSRLKEKYDLMKTDAHSFYRATPSLFYYDLTHDFSAQSKLLDRPAPHIIIDGDAHLKNFGTIKGPDKTAFWGLNDYDQAEKGSPEWDLERMAVSLVLTARQAHVDDETIARMIEHLGKKYFATIKEIASGEKAPHPAYLEKTESHGKIEQMIKEAEGTNQKDFLKDYKKTDSTGAVHFIHTKKVIPVSDEVAEKIKTSLSSYEKTLGDTPRMARPLRILDVAEKLGSGGSSYGMPRYYAFVANSNPDKEPIILELKELFPSGITDQSGNLKNADGKILVEDQKAMQQNLGNPLTGYTRIDGNAYLVREYEREKANTPVEDFKHPDDLDSLAKQAAEVLAFAHGRTTSQAEKINDWVKDDTDMAIAKLKEFAFAYADKVHTDYKAFKHEF